MKIAIMLEVVIHLHLPSFSVVESRCAAVCAKTGKFSELYLSVIVCHVFLDMQEYTIPQDRFDTTECDPMIWESRWAPPFGNSEGSDNLTVQLCLTRSSGVDGFVPETPTMTVSETLKYYDFDFGDCYDIFHERPMKPKLQTLPRRPLQPRQSRLRLLPPPRCDYYYHYVCHSHRLGDCPSPQPFDFGFTIVGTNLATLKGRFKFGVRMLCRFV
ncbi:hypothetical protein C8J56DRAFT_902161 [Mycena floridula]|nr:hypothetical protein C8J56DRAFT_902161 [Mycena floridula]